MKIVLKSAEVKGMFHSSKTINMEVERLKTLDPDFANGVGATPFPQTEEELDLTCNYKALKSEKLPNGDYEINVNSEFMLDTMVMLVRLIMIYIGVAVMLVTKIKAFIPHFEQFAEKWFASEDTNDDVITISPNRADSDKIAEKLKEAVYQELRCEYNQIEGMDTATIYGVAKFPALDNQYNGFIGIPVNKAGKGVGLWLKPVKYVGGTLDAISVASVYVPCNTVNGVPSYELDLINKLYAQDITMYATIIRKVGGTN